jgi:type IX secretion system PorP/SprF family membrane protein
MNKNIQSYFFGIILTGMMGIVPSVDLFSQEAGYFGHTYLQPVLINPGATGFNEDHQIMAGYKHMWSDFPDAPRTFTALYHGGFADNIGLGFQLLSDQVGVSQLIHGQLNYAYRFAFDKTILSVGLSTGLQTYKITDTQNDPLLDPTDVLLNEAIDGYLLFDGSAGLYGEVDKRFFFGISFPNLVKNRLTDISGDSDINLPEFDKFSYAFLVGYRFNIQDYNFNIEPSLQVKDLRYSPFLIDANVKFSFLEEQLVGGIGYTLGDNSKASLLLGTRINQLHILYSYDVSLGDFQQYNNGSHELTLVYKIPHKSAPTPE